LEHQGLDTEARDYFTKAIAVSEKIITKLSKSTATADPYYLSAAADSYYLSAVCYRRLGEYEKAIERYREVVDSWPDYERACSAQFSIGRCYEKLEESGDLNESEANALIEQAYSSVIESYPECGLAGKAWKKLGWLNFEKGQWAKAAGCFELSLEKSPDDRKPVHILYTLGRAYEEIGQSDKAGQVYNEFIQTTYPGDPRIEKVQARLDNLALPTNN
jgi:tetratricopeptide (TPR) repeat protein